MEFLCKNNRIDGFKKKFNGEQYVLLIEVLKNMRGEYMVTRINGGAIGSIILPGDSKKTVWNILMYKLNRLTGRSNFFRGTRKATMVPYKAGDDVIRDIQGLFGLESFGGESSTKE
ncbi:hypothetical protein L484_020787 [Morus notabilis]|uniref:Uncharacterized protein n=1 Tax=Morus notabilis TaxID=981085 RepID=W9RV89_9ROSA|nr:hypothetical protein L484_020787 [Morus notabilis]